MWFRHSAFYLNRRKKNTDVGNNDKQGTNRSQFPKLWTPNPENSTCQLRKGVARWKLCHRIFFQAFFTINILGSDIRRKRDKEKRSLRSVVHAVQAGMFVDRIFRKHSEAAYQLPPVVEEKLKVVYTCLGLQLYLSIGLQSDSDVQTLLHPVELWFSRFFLKASGSSYCLTVLTCLCLAFRNIWKSNCSGINYCLPREVLSITSY